MERFFCKSWFAFSSPTFVIIQRIVIVKLYLVLKIYFTVGFKAIVLHQERGNLKETFVQSVFVDRWIYGFQCFYQFFHL